MPAQLNAAPHFLAFLLVLASPAAAQQPPRSADGEAPFPTASDEAPRPLPPPRPAAAEAPAATAPDDAARPTPSSRSAAPSQPARQAPAPRPRPASDQAPLFGEAIEVTATQTERPVDESPAPVLVLQRRDLERTGTLDLSRALVNAPGVTVTLTEASARGGGPGVSIQGLDGKHVLVLLNGRPFAGDSDGVVDVSAIPVSLLERIEIVSGPMAVLYGTGAIGGVINLITRGAEPGAGGPHLSSNARYATYNTVDASQALSYATPRLSGLLVGNYSASDGFDLDPTFPDTDGERYRRSSAFASLAWRPRPRLDLRLDTLFGTSDRLRIYQDTRYVSTLGKIYYHDWTWDETRLFSTLSFDWRRDAFSLTGWTSVSLYTRRYVDAIEGALSKGVRDTAARDITGRIQATWLPGSSLMLLGGIDLRSQALDIRGVDYDENGTPGDPTSEVDTGRLTQLEAFVLADKTFFHDRLELYGGTRLNYTDLFGFYPPSMLNVRWRPLPLLNLRANLGLGYRTPNLKELNYDLDHSAYGYVIHGNKGLEPEHSLDTRLSAELDGGDRGLIRAGYFYNDVINLIDFVEQPAPDENGNRVFQMENIAAAVTQGAEAIGATRVGPLDLTLAYQYLDARDKRTGLPLLYRSTHTAKLNATLRLGDSGVELTQVVRYQGKQWVTDNAGGDSTNLCLDAFQADLSGSTWNPQAIDAAVATCYQASIPFFVLDAQVQARIRRPGGPLILVYAGVDNAADVVRTPSPLTTDDVSANQTLDVRPMPGRTFYLGLRGEL